LTDRNQAIELINGSWLTHQVGEPAEAVAPTRRIHKVRLKTMETSVERTRRKSLEIGTSGQQEDGEVESIAGPPEPGGDPGETWVHWFGSFTMESERLAVEVDMKRSPVLDLF